MKPPCRCYMPDGKHHPHCAIHVDCPACGAVSGGACRSIVSQKPMKGFHQTRDRAERARRLRYREDQGG